MKESAKIKKIVSNHSRKIKETFGIKELGIFDFYLCEKKTDNDINILIEFEKGKKNFDKN